jgi:hypothetical protein
MRRLMLHLMPLLSRSWCTTLVLLLAAVTPAAAQERAADAELERMNRFARAFAAVAAARDESQATLALPANKTPEAQRDEREKLKARVARIVKDHGFTADEYARMTYLVSTDAAARAQFEELLARLTPKPDPR